MRSLYASEHLNQRNFFVEVDQLNVGKVRVPGMPSKYGNSNWEIRRSAPRLGEHNEQIFCGELGISKDRLAALKEVGIV